MKHCSALVLVLVGALVLVGCRTIPENASVTEYCKTGEAYTNLKDVPFEQGLAMTKKLAAVGTPAGIDASARAGFVELINRMEDSRDAADFRRRTDTMGKAEEKHLLALYTYNQKICSQPVG